MTPDLPGPVFIFQLFLHGCKIKSGQGRPGFEANEVFSCRYTFLKERKSDYSCMVLLARLGAAPEWCTSG